MGHCFRRVQAACLTLAVVVPQARADFQMRPVAAAPLPIPSATDATATPELLRRLRPEQAAKPRFHAAVGFGTDIPLAFAARQIVPAGVEVRYSAGIDEDLLVSWTGGRSWNRVLADAVAPLRLRITVGTRTVLISR